MCNHRTQKQSPMPAITIRNIPEPVHNALPGSPLNVAYRLRLWRGQLWPIWRIRRMRAGSTSANSHATGLQLD
jgi:hypothetical protein